MVTNRAKSRVALIIAAAFLIAAAVLGFLFFSMTENANPSPSPNTEEQAYDGLFPVVDWDYWKSINPDVIGWVTVPDTQINYPIMQAHEDDPDFYLHHDIYGNWSVYGIPYLDASNEETGLFNSKNAVVFGHHMNDGSMFAAFADYSGEQFAQEHQMILVQSPDKKVIYNARCVEIIDGTSLAKRTEFLDETDYMTWYQDQLVQAVVALDSDTIPDSLITFCTCSYNYFASERTLVLASEEEIYWQSEESLAQERLATKASDNSLSSASTN